MMKNRLLGLSSFIAGVLVTLAVVGSANDVQATGLNQMATFKQPLGTCLPSEVMCLQIVEDWHPHRQPEALVRIQTGTTPRWESFGSACPDASRPDIAAYAAVPGGEAWQWRFVGYEGDLPVFVFHSDQPTLLTVNYGRLDVPGGTVTAKTVQPVLVHDATWRCINAFDDRIPLPPEPVTTRPLTEAEAQRWCNDCRGFWKTTWEGSNQIILFMSMEKECPAGFDVPLGVSFDAATWTNGTVSGSGPQLVERVCEATFRLTAIRT